MQALVEVKRAKKSKDGFPDQAEPPRESAVGGPGSGKGLAIDRVWDDRDLLAGNAACGHFVPETLTNRCHRIGVAQSTGLQKSCRPIAQTIGAGGATAPVRGVFPERTHFVNHRRAMPAAGPERGQCVEDGRVGVKDPGLTSVMTSS